jgi:hypothetical protein
LHELDQLDQRLLNWKLMVNQLEAIGGPPGRVSALDVAEFLAMKNVKALESPKPKLPFVLVNWFTGVELVGQDEMEQTIEIAAPTFSHKHVLATLIWQGESLLVYLRDDDVTKQLGLTIADVEATVEG